MWASPLSNSVAFQHGSSQNFEPIIINQTPVQNPTVLARSGVTFCTTYLLHEQIINRHSVQLSVFSLAGNLVTSYLPLGGLSRNTTQFDYMDMAADLGASVFYVAACSYNKTYFGPGGFAVR